MPIEGFDPKNHYFMPVKFQHLSNTDLGYRVAQKQSQWGTRLHVLGVQEKGGGRAPEHALSTLENMEAYIATKKSIVDYAYFAFARTILKGYTAKMGWCYWLWTVTLERVRGGTDLGKIQAAVKRIEEVCKANSVNNKGASGFALMTLQDMQESLAGNSLIIDHACSVEEVARAILKGYTAKMGWCYWLWIVAVGYVRGDTGLRKIQAAVKGIEEACQAKGQYDTALTAIRKELYLRYEKNPKTDMTELQRSRALDSALRPHMEIFKNRVVSQDSLEDARIDDLLSKAIKSIADIRNARGGDRLSGQEVEMVYYPLQREQRRESLKTCVGRLFPASAPIEKVATAPSPADLSGKGAPAGSGRGALSTGGRGRGAPSTRSRGAIVKDPFVAANLDAPNNAAVWLAKAEFFDAALHVAQLVSDDEVNKSRLIQTLEVGKIAGEASDAPNDQQMQQVMAALDKMEGLDHPFLPLAKRFFASGFACRSDKIDDVLGKLVGPNCRYWQAAEKAIKVWKLSSERESVCMERLVRAQEKGIDYFYAND